MSELCVERTSFDDAALVGAADPPVAAAGLAAVTVSGAGADWRERFVEGLEKRRENYNSANMAMEKHTVEGADVSPRCLAW